MIKKEIEQLIEEVATARGLTVHDIKGNGRSRDVTCARRAVAMIVLDKYGMREYHNNALSWLEVAKIMNTARSTLHSASRKWATAEGAQDGKEEERLRETGCLLQQSEESIHQMAKRVCKRGLSQVPKGRRKELGYWRSEGKVNCG
jgi:hypothetical protein